MVFAVIRVPREVAYDIVRSRAIIRKAALFALLLMIGCGTIGRAEDRPFRTEYLEDSPAMILSRMAIRAYEEKSQDWPEQKTLPMAMAYYVTRDYLKASLLFERVLAKEPANLCALLGYGESLAGLEKFKEAVPPLKEVWEKTQKIDALVKLATCYHRLGDKKAFEALVPDLISYEFDDIEGALSVLCNYALVEPDERRAREILESALAGVPDGYIAGNEPLTIEVQAALKRFELKERQQSLEKAVRVLADE